MLTESIEPTTQEARAVRVAVRVLLAAKEMRQTELAARVGVDKGTLSRVLAGHLHRPDVWQRIGSVLNGNGAHP